MGLFFNPGNTNFRVKRNDTYVDKTGMIRVVNGMLGKKDKLSCVSRPRRFGKTYATAMLVAYYDKSCDSSGLFDDLIIAKDPDYRTYLNKYDVMYLDMTYFMSELPRGGNLVSFTRKMLVEELAEMYPEWVDENMTVSRAMECVYDHDGSQYIAVIDEWDAPIRKADATEADKHDYLEFLRSFFKNTAITDKVFAGAYMTGILPIKKDGSQSAISEFREYSILSPGRFAPFIGFTEQEVMGVCEKTGLDFSEMKKWYDGYTLPGIGSIYNSNSVMRAVESRSFESYWSASSSASSLINYMSLDYAGMGDVGEKLLADQRVSFDPLGFENDPNDIKDRDDVLTLMVHYGYLSYDMEMGSARIPNEEIRLEYARAVRKVRRPDTIRRVQESDQLITDVVYMRSEEVAKAIEKVHREEFAPLHYNNEQSLRAVIKLAFFAYKDKYTQLEELASGTGYADIVYLPKKYSDMPIMVVELKWNKDADTALDQIHRKHYPDVLKDREEPIFLVGVSYDRDDPEKKHSCIVEEYMPIE